MWHTLYRVVLIGGWVIGSVIRGKYRGPVRKQKVIDERYRTQEALLLLLSSVGMFILPILYLTTPWFDGLDYALPVWMGGVGAALHIWGTWLLWRVHVDLGANWSPSLQVFGEHELVTGGVYTRIRHPMYASTLLWAVAQVFLLQNWVAGPCFLISVIPLILVRLPREERMMAEHFGEAYREYMTRTRRLIPGVW